MRVKYWSLNGAYKGLGLREFGGSCTAQQRSRGQRFRCASTTKILLQERNAAYEATKNTVILLRTEDDKRARWKNEKKKECCWLGHEKHGYTLRTEDDMRGRKKNEEPGKEREESRRWRDEVVMRKRKRKDREWWTAEKWEILRREREREVVKSDGGCKEPMRGKKKRNVKY